MPAVLLIALLPAAGNLLGGALAEGFPVVERWQGIVLHVAVGVVLGVVAIEIMPDAVDALDSWQVAAAFACGGLVYLLIAAIARRGVSGTAASGGRTSMIYVAVAADLFGDGLMIGAGTSLATEVGLALAIGQVIADVPEGAATAVVFRGAGIARRRRLMLSASFIAPALVGAALAYVLLRGRPEAWQLAALVGTAGLFTLAVVEDMSQEAHDHGPDTAASTIALIAGFSTFALVSGGVS